MRVRFFNNQNILKNTPLLISILAAIVVFTIAVLIIEQRRNIKITQTRLELASEMKRVNTVLNDFFGDMYSGVAAITRIVNENGEVRNFPAVAKEILSHNTWVNDISLMPGGIVKYTYPAQGNVAFNKKILHEGSREEAAGALASYISKKIVIAGPFTNFAGRECIAARLPVFIDGKFWGFSSTLVKLEDLLKASNITRANPKYKYSLSYISYINGEEIFFWGRRPESRQTVLEEQMSHINWKFYIESNMSGFSLFWLPAIFSFLGSIGIGVVIKKILDRAVRLQTLLYQKDQQIAEAQKEFKAIFDNAPIGFALINHNTQQFSSTNETFRRIFGLKKSAAPNPDETSPASQQLFTEILKKIDAIVAGSNPQVSGEYRHVTEAGDEIWTHYKLFALPTPVDAGRKFAVIAEDITEKLAAERKLKYSEKKYRHLFDESPIALWEEDFQM